MNKYEPPSPKPPAVNFPTSDVWLTIVFIISAFHLFVLKLADVTPDRKP